ncbi:hypothetical protein GAY28_09840 [Azospirillum brasilense]|nr:hypothetical protein [Azospirillum brasilense]
MHETQDPTRLAVLGACQPPADAHAQVLALAHALDLHAWHAAPLNGGGDSAGGAVREALGALSREGGAPAVVTSSRKFSKKALKGKQA